MDGQWSLNVFQKRGYVRRKRVRVYLQCYRTFVVLGYTTNFHLVVRFLYISFLWEPNEKMLGYFVYGDSPRGNNSVTAGAGSSGW